MECTAMISFNDASAGKDAQELADFLTKNQIPTFCTRVFCPKTPGDWRKFCEAGAAKCVLYIPLMTKGWQMSRECQAETVIVKNRSVKGKVTIYPVWYDLLTKSTTRTPWAISSQSPGGPIRPATGRKQATAGRNWSWTTTSSSASEGAKASQIGAAGHRDCRAGESSTAPGGRGQRGEEEIAVCLATFRRRKVCGRAEGDRGERAGYELAGDRDWRPRNLRRSVER
eukprot:3937309-Rhodomonas_salina.2